MRRVHEYTNLAKARVFYDGKGSYTFNFNKGIKLPNPYVFRGDHDSFVRFLMGIKAKDNKTYPRSVRGERYADIAYEIENGTDQIIYVWEHDFMRYINKQKNKKFSEGVFSVRDTEHLADIIRAEYDGFFTESEGKDGDVIFTSTQSRGFVTEIQIDTWGEYVSLTVWRDKGAFAYSVFTLDVRNIKRINCTRRTLYFYMTPGSQVNGNQVIVAVY